MIPDIRPERDAIFLARCLLAWLVIFVFFRNLPGLDLGVTTLFCRDVATSSGLLCEGFAARKSGVAAAFRSLFYWIPVLAPLALLANIAWTGLRSGCADRETLRSKAILIGGFLLGPVLIVNGLLKTFSGRPRPHETIEFGGTLPFAAAGDFSGACIANCSFVSGEAASAGWLICLLPLLKGRFRTVLAAVIIDISIATPLLRVAMGGHYPSDVALGWIIGLASPAALSLLLIFRPTRISATLERAR
ncbi:phosphatase PAP2 family protein [Rhizobium sp. TH2]|uniref:phosphatase PAP2 family protein n=1 Tax=Rhizobium sp. TH2 TaxID=2775403 RepID=UPI0021574083|nr:phosphatase PAP2 family protein [Rhizobium sp. TH2]